MALAYDENVDQWDRIGNPEINTFIDGHLIFDSGIKTIKWIVVPLTNGVGSNGYAYLKEQC